MRAVEAAGVQVDRFVVVDGAEHVVEVDPAVEEAPGHVAHQRAQVAAGVHGVAHGTAVAGLPADVHEVFVAAEAEAAERKVLVAERGVGLRRDHAGEFCGCVHGVFLNWS
jgi:phosphoenolpyruvate-protein kinase (PTS system EI component)